MRFHVFCCEGEGEGTGAVDIVFKIDETKTFIKNMCFEKLRHDESEVGHGAKAKFLMFCVLTDCSNVALKHTS